MSTVDAVSFPLPVTPDGQPNPMLLELTRDTPVLKVRGPGGGDAWLISSQSVVHEVLADPARFTSMIDPDETSSRAVMVVTDPPQHTRLRRLAAQAFTARRVQALVPGIEQRVATLLDAMEDAGPPLDLIPALSVPLPVGVICQILGVPEEDEAQLRKWSDAFIALTSYEDDAIGVAMEEFSDYTRRLTAERRKNLRDDVLSNLIRARDGRDAMSDDELTSLMVLLLVAGHETTVKSITRGVMILSLSGQWEHLVSGAAPVEAVVEEILRHQTPIDTQLFRWARADTELAGVPIKAGEALYISLNLANFDPETRKCPEAFEPLRADAGHLSFGYGAHFCLGAALARAELIAVFGALAKRFPSLQLAVPIGELTWTVGSMLNCPQTLPVTW